MEWMLQVVDELDDAVGALRHWGHGAWAEVGGWLLAGSAAACAIAAAISTHTEPVLSVFAAVMLATAAALKIRGLPMQGRVR